MTDNTQPRDYTQVIDSLSQARRDTMNDLDHFERLTLAILQEFDAQNLMTSDDKIDKVAPIEELVVGELYENEDGEKYMHLGGASDQYYPFKFYSYEDDRIEYVNSYGKIYPGTELPIIRKHTPAPKEHYYTDEEIINELETWQDEPISPKHFCIRGQMLRQLLKEGL